MKPARKKKIVLPRKYWQINPVTRVLTSAKDYKRPRVKRSEQRFVNEE